MFRSTEQTNFHNIIKQHMSASDAPLLLEGATGLGKTRAYLSAVAASTKRIAIVLPTHALIDQLLASKDLEAVGLEVSAFRPARFFEARKDYEVQRDTARKARVLVCTAAAVIIDQRLSGEYNGVTTDRDYLLFDEADQLPEMDALQSDFTIPHDMLTSTDLRLSLERLGKAGRQVEPEIRAAARVMLEIVKEPVGYARVGVDDEGNACLHHRLPGRLLKKISNRASVAFVSATLSVSASFKNFTTAMGITDVSALSTVIEPAKHGALTFEVQDLEVGTDEWFAAIVDTARTADKPVLVATTSHDLTDRLKVDLAGEEGVLVKAAAWAGLDLLVPPRTVIVPQVPFGQPVVIDGQIESSYLDARVMAQRRMKQVIGRGLRTPDAVCRVVVLDGRVRRIGQFVPERFAGAWANAGAGFVEGARVELVLSRAERDPALIAAALKYHGMRCQHPGCGVEQAHMLDVHHLDPVSEGVRRTTVKDVVVLCANHHREAHFEMRLAVFSGAEVPKVAV